MSEPKYTDTVTGDVYTSRQIQLKRGRRFSHHSSFPHPSSRISRKLSNEDSYRPAPLKIKPRYHILDSSVQSWNGDVNPAKIEIVSPQSPSELSVSGHIGLFAFRVRPYPAAGSMRHGPSCSPRKGPRALGVLFVDSRGIVLDGVHVGEGVQGCD